ncbi:hypothetical protein M0Q97_03400 [Candidatus Dojkabacteria bacterium]|nr:hypothetical protein [Candidatus Dojkabacteria bacterium]
MRTTYWTKERCQEEALKYSSRSEFERKSGSAYIASLRNKWIDEVCNHMNTKIHHWTKERCQEEASKYKRRVEFIKNSNSAYQKALRCGWLDEICSHMIEYHRKPKKYWTKERCQEEALKYDIRSNFQKGIPVAYQTALNKGWLNDICSHMRKIIHSNWTKSECHFEALKYYNRFGFQKGSISAYQKALKCGWLNDICSHMVIVK